MSTDYRSPAFKKLLDSLQQQSWELELIISGFAIFGLFSAYEPLTNNITIAKNEDSTALFFFYGAVLFSCSILLFNLVLHVILRGLWIGALGLRYVSGDIEFDKLKYTEKFTKFLKKRIVSFDRYIANLENYCSILFAISFLLIFYLLAIIAVNSAMVLIVGGIMESDFLPEWLKKSLAIPLLIFLFIGMLATFFDFITQGLLKKNKWVAKLYFPFYRVFSFLTLSFLYRPLIYNFLDNKFGKRLILMLTPVYLVILFLTSFQNKRSNVLDREMKSSQSIANKENYLDRLTEKKDYPGNIALQSKVVTTPYLQIFVPYSETIEDHIFAYDSILKPKNDNRGWKSSIVMGWNRAAEDRSPSQNDSLSLSYLKVFNDLYSLRIGKNEMDGDFVFTTTSQDIMGFETFIGIDSLPEGKHEIQLMRLQHQKDSITLKEDGIVPFWYFKD